MSQLSQNRYSDEIVAFQLKDYFHHSVWISSPLSANGLCWWQPPKQPQASMSVYVCVFHSTVAWLNLCKYCQVFLTLNLHSQISALEFSSYLWHTQSAKQWFGNCVCCSMMPVVCCVKCNLTTAWLISQPSQEFNTVLQSNQVGI